MVIFLTKDYLLGRWPQLLLLFFFFLILTHGYIFIDFRGRAGERERSKEKQRERETLMWERNIEQLPPVCSLTGDRTHNLLVYETTLPPTRPRCQGSYSYFKKNITPILLILKYYSCHSPWLHSLFEFWSSKPGCFQKLCLVGEKIVTWTNLGFCRVYKTKSSTLYNIL